MSYTNLGANSANGPVPAIDELCYLPAEHLVALFARGIGSICTFGNVNFVLTCDPDVYVEKYFHLGEHDRRTFYIIGTYNEKPTPVWETLKGKMFVLMKGVTNGPFGRVSVPLMPQYNPYGQLVNRFEVDRRMFFTHEEDAIRVGAASPDPALGVMAALAAGMRQ